MRAISLSYSGRGRSDPVDGGGHDGARSVDGIPESMVIGISLLRGGAVALIRVA
jgi:hypothetical protein